MILHYDRIAEERLVWDDETGAMQPVTIALKSGGFVLVWTDRQQTNGSRTDDIRVQIFGADGAPAGPSFAAASGPLVQDEPAATPLADGGFALAWREIEYGVATALKIQAYDAAGAAVGAAITIPGSVPSDPAIAQLADGTLAVTWMSHLPGSDQYDRALQTQLFSPDGTALGEPMLVTEEKVGDWSDPRIAPLASGGFVLTWFHLDGPPAYYRLSKVQVFDADGAAVTPAFDLAALPYSEHRFSDVAALEGGGFVAVWADDPRLGEPDVKAQIFRDDGSRVGTEFVVNQLTDGPQGHPKVAAVPGGGFVVSWYGWDGRGDTTGANAISAQIFDASGGRVGDEFVVNQSQGNEGLSAVSALPSGEIVVAWTVEGQVRLQHFGDSAGDGVEDILLSTGIVAEHSVAGLVAATLSAPGGVVNGPVAYTLLDDTSGAFEIVGNALVVADSRKLDFERTPAVELTVRATDASGVAFEKRLTLDLTDQPELDGSLRAGDGFLVNTSLPGSQHNVGAAKLAGGGYVLVWQSVVSSKSTMVAQLFDAAGAKLGGEIVLGGGDQAQSGAVSALGDGFVAVWMSEVSGVATLLGQRFDSAGTTLGGEFAVADMPIPRHVFKPHVEMLAGGGFAVAWRMDGADGLGDVFVRRYDAAGTALGPAVMVNDAVATHYFVGNLTAFADGGFLVTWGGEGVPAQGRRFAADGTAMAPFQIGGASLSTTSAVAASQPDGSFALLWTGSGRPTLQLFDATGAKVGPAQTIVAGDGTAFGYPTLAAQPDGSYLVAWSYSADDWSYDHANIVVQRVSPAGELVGAPFEANDIVYRLQQLPVMATGGDGSFLIAWSDQSDLGGDSQLGGPRARIFTDVSASALALDDRFATDEATALSGLSVFADNGLGADRESAAGVRTIVAVNGSAAAVGQTVTLASGALLTLHADGRLTYDPNGAHDSLYAPSWGASFATSAVERVTYTLAGGSTASVIVTVRGLGMDPDVVGTSGDDVLTGTDRSDFFMLGQSGDDEASAGAGDDVFYMGAALSASDRLDGGEGKEQVALQGDYSAGLTLGVGNLVAVETLALLSGLDTRFGDSAGNLYGYTLTTVDENVGAGERLTIDAAQLASGENFRFVGSAETDGSFYIYAGKGTDNLTGGAKLDVFLFRSDGRFTADDRVDGGGGNDQLALRGAYNGATAISMQADTIKSIEVLAILSGQNEWFGPNVGALSYEIAMHDGNVAAGRTLIVDAAQLRATETLTFDGSLELDGGFRIWGGLGGDTINGGAQADIITGGGGADRLRGGAGNDIFRYKVAGDSALHAGDAILDFTSGDRIDLSAVDAASGEAGVQDFTFIGGSAFSGVAGQLRAENVSGSTWLVQGDRDGDGVADLEITVVGADTDPITAIDFVF